MRKLNIHIFQHVAFEGPVTIYDWAAIKGHRVRFTKFFEKFTFPELSEVDFLIVMGGPMSFDQFDKYPWLKDETGFIRSAIVNNKAVLGICLGAQLIAQAFDGSAKHGKIKEIGWFPVTFNKHALKQSDFNFIPEEMVVFHWHSDTFDIPGGALHLASSQAYINQAFLFKDRVLGMQFHCESDHNSILSLIRNAGHELAESDYIQTMEKIISQNKFYENNNRIMRMILDKIENNLE
jgi:GMP synthase-like glutamine amidotransferase